LPKGLLLQETKIRMRKLTIVSLFLLSLKLSAQPLRLHIKGGFANYSGELQQRSFTLNQAGGVLSAGATFEISNNLALRSDYSLAKVGGDDKYGLTTGAIGRNLNFKTLVRELSLMGEYNLFDIYDKGWSPYIFAGVGVFKFSPYTTDSSGAKVFLAGLGTEGQGLSAYSNRLPYKRTQLNIPFGGGIKYALSDDIHLTAEVGFRKLFTDYFDDVSTTYADENLLYLGRGPQAVQLAFRGDELKNNPQQYPQEGAQRGNPKSKDWYYFGQVGISFRMNWFDNREYSRSRKSKVDCPKVL
jgi:opacity protein-like surface antigen